MKASWYGIKSFPAHHWRGAKYQRPLGIEEVEMHVMEPSKDFFVSCLHIIKKYHLSGLTYPQSWWSAHQFGNIGTDNPKHFTNSFSI